MNKDVIEQQIKEWLKAEEIYDVFGWSPVESHGTLAERASLSE